MQHQQQLLNSISLPDNCCDIARRWKETNIKGRVPHAKDCPVAIEQKK